MILWQRSNLGELRGCEVSLPTATELREFLQGYGLDSVATEVRTGDITSGSPTVDNIDTEELLTGMRVSGSGIPDGALVESVDHKASQVTLDVNATATTVGESLTFTYFLYMTNDWIEKRRDRFVVPWVENKCRQSFTGQKTVIEYHSGSGSTVLHLDTKPIVSVDEIEIVSGGVNSEYLIGPGSVEVISSEGILKARRNWDISAYAIPLFPKGTKNIKVTFTAGWDVMPNDISEALLYLMAEVALGQIANRTGGGGLTVQAFGRDYGARGKYTHQRDDLARQALGILNKYFTGSVGG